MASEAEVMAVAHDSWAEKQRLATAVRDAIQALGENVYTEYNTFRMCDRKTAWQEAVDYIALVTEGAVTNTGMSLGRKVHGR